MLLIQYVFVLHGKLSGPAGYVKINAGENTTCFIPCDFIQVRAHTCVFYSTSCACYTVDL